MSENLRMLLTLIWRGVGLKMGEDYFILLLTFQK